MAKRGRNQEELFIDRDPTHFAEVLNYLRDGKKFCPPSDDEAHERLQREAKFYKLPGLAEMCLPSDFHVGDIVQWKPSANEIYWKFFVRYQYHEREWARCMACSDNVFGMWVRPLRKIKRSLMKFLSNLDWVPLEHHMSFMKGSVIEVSNSCCGVKWDAWETHLPKSALRKTK